METVNQKSKLDFILLKGNVLAYIYELNKSESSANDYREHIEKFDKMWISKGKKNDFSKGHSIWNNPVVVDKNKKINHVLRDPFFNSFEVFFMKEGIRKVIDIKEKDLIKVLYTANTNYKKYFSLLRVLFGDFGKNEYNSLMEEKKRLDSIGTKYDEKKLDENEEKVQEKETEQDFTKEDFVSKKDEDLMKNLKEADMRIKKDLEEVSSTINSVLKESWENEEEIQQLNIEIQNSKEENTKLKKEIEDLRRIKEDFSKLKELLLRMDREHAES